jgi:hypothetical protein
MGRSHAGSVANQLEDAVDVGADRFVAEAQGLDASGGGDAVPTSIFVDIMLPAIKLDGESG